MKKTRIKIVLLHTAIWLLWYLFNLYDLEVPLTKFSTAEWLQLAYNYSSITIIFYTVARIMTGVYRDFSYSRYVSPEGLVRTKFTINSKVFFLPAVVAVYVCVSIFFDNVFFGYKYPTIMSHILQRFTRILLYVTSAILYSFLTFYIQKLKRMVITSNRRIKQLQENNRELRELIEQLDDESLLN
jgi:hypothetical protein